MVNRKMVLESVAAIHAKAPDFQPKYAFITGSGLNALADAIDMVASFNYSEIPHFPSSTVAGHAGRLVLGHLEGVPVICFQGRVHLYEGIDPEKIKVMVRTVKELQCEALILTNAAGSLRPEAGAGELSLITDHINMMYINPMLGPNDDEYGDRFPVLHEAYNPVLNERFRRAASTLPFDLHEGVYLASVGPCFETPAEIRMFQKWGADLVGMSTVPEVIVARHCGLNVAAISVIVNLAEGLSDVIPTHEETLKFGAIGSENLIKLFKEFVKI